MYFNAYYEQEGNYYNLHFTNYKKWKLDVIMQNFSAYGDIIKVRTVGKLSGHCIVQYQTRDEASCAMINLKSQDVSADAHIQKYLETDKSDEPFAKVKEERIPALIPADQHVKPPSQVSSSSFTTDNSMSSKQRTVLAAEVIVANIHPAYSIHYILHLLKNYSPISVSLMKQIEGTCLRYCHVYFEQPEQAMIIEKEFDKFKLSDTSLIVLRPHSLMEEAGLYGSA